MALYLMLSRTNTGMGKVIRKYTGAHYNHVSLTLDGAFHSFVSFARYRQDVPLVGGYVRESAERILSTPGELSVRIFRLELDEQQEKALETLFAKAGNPTLIYDSLSALVSRWHIPGCYTCLGFTSRILGRDFRSLQELEAYLEPHAVFTGDLRQLVTDSGDRSDPFFQKRGLMRGTGDTAVHFGKLLMRLLRITRCQDILQSL
ncbi:MAG: hypothetical protein IJV82_06500 [Oscillospiraceae bacterium]|nr:hypothetical protein [Oscillospiraceae bacterium]